MTTTRNTLSEPVPFEASDFLNLDRLLSDEERTVREEVNGFVREKIKPYVRDWWEKASFPRKIVPEMGAQGLLGCTSLDTGAPGFSAKDIVHKVSMRTSVQTELYLEDCRRPSDAMLPEAKGLRGDRSPA